MQKVEGGWCLEPEETLNEIQQFAVSELKQVKAEDLPIPPPAGPMVYDEELDPTPMDVVAGFRRTNPNKAGTGWSVPNKLWVILENEISDKFAEVWQQMGRERKFPISWQKQKCAWMDKPGKRGRTIREKRGIMLSGASCKAYSNWTQRRTRNKMRGKWRDDSFGAIPGRGTAQALMKVFATRQQIKKSKKSSITFMGDGIKAFDRIDRRKVLDKVHDELGDRDLGWRHEIRHDRVLVATEAEDKELVMAMQDGVPQGDPNGPVLYVIGYSGVAEDIDCERESKGYGGLRFENGIGPNNNIHDICRTTFVDDHSETHFIETEGHTLNSVQTQIKERVKEIMDNQAKWKVTNNMGKTVILIELYGKGSRKLKKQLGNKIEIMEGVEIQVVRNNKYLGVQVGGIDESTGQEITQRIKSAGEAVTRLRKFWRLKGVTTETKIKAYEQLVRTVLVYGLETRVLSKAQLMRVECFQTRVLRRIGESQSHLTHESNEDVRDRLKVPSIDSFLARTRIRLWQQITVNPNPAVISAVTGRIEGEESWGSAPHLQQLCKDLSLLARQGGPDIPSNISKRGKVILDLSTTGPIATMRKQQSNKVLNSSSMCEVKTTHTVPLETDLTFVCDQAGCTASFTTNHRLQTHRVRSRGYRDTCRSLVVDEYCPMCNNKFASKVGAMNHIQKVCGTKGTEEERGNKVRKILLARQVANCGKL